MPAASWRTRPARTRSLWLTAWASAGSSRRVGMSDRVQRTALRFLALDDLVGPGDARPVSEPRHGRAAEDVGLEDFPKIRFLDAAVPDVLGIHDHHRPVAALGKAARLVDPDLPVLSGLGYPGAEDLHVLLGVSLGGTGLPARAHKHVDLILTHGASPEPRGPARPASRR